MKFQKLFNSGESETTGLPKPEIIEIGMAGAVHCLSCKIPWLKPPTQLPTQLPTQPPTQPYDQV